MKRISNIERAMYMLICGLVMFILGFVVTEVTDTAIGTIFTIVMSSIMNWMIWGS